MMPFSSTVRGLLAAGLLAIIASPFPAKLSGAGTSEAGDPVDCVKPLVAPDRWDDADGDGAWDVGELYDPDLTGFTTSRDAGIQVSLHHDATPGPVILGQYYIFDLPPLGYGEAPHTGGDAFRAAMSECSPYPVAVGDSVQLEPGVLVTEVVEEVQAIIDADPDAYWDASNARVQGSIFAESPRLIRLAFMDPTLPPQSGRNYVIVVKIGVLFVESVASSGTVTGRFTSFDPLATPVQRTTWGRLHRRFGTRAH